TGLIYNKALFEKNGWTVPTNWDEMFELGAKAKEQGISLYTYQGLYPIYLQWGLLPSAYSAMDDDAINAYLNYGEGSVVNSPIGEVLHTFEKMAKEGYILPGTAALNHTQSQQEMMMDKALFIPCGTWIEGEMADAPRAEGFEFAMAPCPAMSEGQNRKVVVAMETMSIPAAAKNPELAKQFLRFLYTDETAVIFAEKSGTVIATKSASELAKPFISDAMYNFYSIFTMDGVAAIAPGFAAQAQGSKIDVESEVFSPAADVVNGFMTADDWAQSIEDAFAQVRYELEAAK
ncbi:MAG: extracellular solute-binding protein, partial [Clostridia bacterium]|nr:extracellular solute-binding protein [Clostridia bacterium]